ncbi:hypothetical protein VNI00_010040 [Paramarasmius palmivorus]|uniref:60S acidic ribosomal protein P1 n=1 Tax=Paramarasmius palmivorus TaxID=297713 RepID=A0AAW0CLJ9_9AGAR
MALLAMALALILTSLEDGGAFLSGVDSSTTEFPLFLVSIMSATGVMPRHFLCGRIYQKRCPTELVRDFEPSRSNPQASSAHPLHDPQNFLLEAYQSFQMASADLAPSYAALILADEGIEITSDKIIALTSAANVELEPIWASLLAKALEGKNVKELLSNIGSGGGAPAAAVGGGAAAGGAAAAEAPKEEEKKEEEKEESDDDMGFGLFD